MMIVIDDAAGMTKYMWEYLDTIVIGGKMDIVDDLRKDAYGERQSIREARIELGGLLEDAANEIERLREESRAYSNGYNDLKSALRNVLFAENSHVKVTDFTKEKE